MARTTGQTRPVIEVRLRRGCLFALKIAVVIAFLVGFPARHILLAQQSETSTTSTISTEKKPALSNNPLTADQLAVYSVVLSTWMDNDKAIHTVHLAVETMPFRLSDMDTDCGKALQMHDGSVNEVHRFRAEDVARLTPSKVELVDPEAQSKEVADNDPGKSIGKGKSIEEAVATGFAHGLTTLGEIHFDKNHTHAIVAYNFSCGRTCGNGSTVILEKKNGTWHVASHCSVSMA